MEVVSDAPAAPPGPRAADLKLNWAAIHALVQEIPKTFRDPSFSNSGRQISRVVTASDPARELEQVKAWQTSLEGIVDELVGTHHGSLSRSIKNYAEIVQLFEVNRANVDTTRAVLNEGRARLVSELNAIAEKVRETWRRTLVSREVARKLADLERLTRLPGTARACVAAGDFENAVALIERANAMLRAPAARDARAALADVRRECAATETFAHAAMAREIGHVVFCCDAPCRRDAANVGRSLTEMRGDATTEKDENGAAPPIESPVRAQMRAHANGRRNRSPAPVYELSSSDEEFLEPPRPDESPDSVEEARSPLLSPVVSGTRGRLSGAASEPEALSLRQRAELGRRA